MSKNLDAEEMFAKRHALEIVSVCRGCNEHWCDIGFYKKVRRCTNCKTGKYFEYYFETGDVLDAFKGMKSIPPDVRWK